MSDRRHQICCAITFRLKPEIDISRFIALSRELCGWLERRDGFIRYELFGSDGEWMDTMIWRDRRAAEAGNKDFLATPLAADMMGMVEPNYRTLMAERVALTA